MIAYIRKHIFVYILLAVVMLSAVCLCAPPENTNNDTENQIAAAKKAADLQPVSFSADQKDVFHRSLKKHVSNMDLGQNNYEKTLIRLRNIIQSFTEWVERLFDRFPKSKGFSGFAYGLLKWTLKITAYILLIGAALALLYLLFLLIRNAWKNRGSNGEAAVLSVVEPETTALDNYDILFEKADKLYREGNVYEAMRCLYLSCIALLVKANLITYSKDKTNRDYLLSLRASENLDARNAFRNMTDIFDSIVYGGKTALSADYESARNHAVALGESL